MLDSSAHACSKSRGDRSQVVVPPTVAARASTRRLVHGTPQTSESHANRLNHPACPTGSPHAMRTDHGAARPRTHRPAAVGLYVGRSIIGGRPTGTRTRLTASQCGCTEAIVATRYCSIHRAACLTDGTHRPKGRGVNAGGRRWVTEAGRSSGAGSRRHSSLPTRWASSGPPRPQCARDRGPMHRQLTLPARAARGASGSQRHPLHARAVSAHPGLAEEVRQLMLLTLLILASQSDGGDLSDNGLSSESQDSRQRIGASFRYTPKTARRAPVGYRDARRLEFRRNPSPPDTGRFGGIRSRGRPRHP